MTKVKMSSWKRDRLASPFSSLISWLRLIFPVMAVLLGRITGLLIFNAFFVLCASLVLGIVALLVIWVAVRLFKREVILTRWS